MPFFDDTGPRVEEEKGPFWRSVALVGDQLERMIFLNIVWAAQSVPLLIAWAVANLPSPVRVGLVLYSAFAFVPATGTLFAALAQASDGIPLSPEMVWDCFKEQFRPSFFKLLPLYSLFYWLGLAAALASEHNLLLVDVLARLAFLFAALLSLYWGSLSARQPQLPAVKIFLTSLRWFWRYPGKTSLAGILSLLTLIVGVVSIGGMFLIVPVLLALIQIQLYRSINV